MKDDMAILVSQNPKVALTILKEMIKNGKGN
jgi:hypothetical protein